MIKNKNILFSLSIAFLIVEIQLSYLIQTKQSEFNYSYFAIVLACAFCFLFAEKSKSYLFTQIALLCTVGADYFLVFTNEKDQLAGMIFFCGTQIAYFLRIFFEEENPKARKIHLITRVSVSVVVLAATCIVLGAKTDPLALVSMFYYTNLILNIIFAFIHFKSSYLLAIGLVCFVICDTFIGFANIGPYMSISESSIIYKLLNADFDIAWAFYVPSQALLSISLLNKEIKKRV